MKFSLAATSAIVLTAFASLARADEYADAMKEWCQGLSVTAPADNAVASAGQQQTITVTRQPDQRTKTITGLDLYSVSQSGDAKYVQNVWSGNYTLNQEASIQDQIPSNATAGLYYYRVWVTNQINGMHGPDCLETSHTFKVTTGVHQDANGINYYTESLDDSKIYHPDHFRGCFGLTVEYPKEGQTFKDGEHIRLGVNRDSSSQTETLKKVDLYKKTGDDEATFVETVWQGSERFVNAFTLKDHLKLDQADETSSYYYVLDVTSNKADDSCTFASKEFKIAPASSA
ncbi:hypothetical protein BCR43DRAFT_498287 [Syncephalastrum racemosum]|uniref:Uncharacterized protein n=1 Tax=Syncephalastrum racemosum TaxID=13706 RepID=A0A1X2H0L3_SYNRA|nr:hypothetical protein BCR43DRAFT_498287 [Syncephalastrum racemosum]